MYEKLINFDPVKKTFHVKNEYSLLQTKDHEVLTRNNVPVDCAVKQPNIGQNALDPTQIVKLYDHCHSNCCMFELVTGIDIKMENDPDGVYAIILCGAIPLKRKIHGATLKAPVDDTK